MTGCLSPGGWCLARWGGSGWNEITGPNRRRALIDELAQNPLCSNGRSGGSSSVPLREGDRNGSSGETWNISLIYVLLTSHWSMFKTNAKYSIYYLEQGRQTEVCEDRNYPKGENLFLSFPRVWNLSIPFLLLLLFLPLLFFQYLWV